LPEFRIPQDRAQISPATFPQDPAGQRRHVHFAEQMTEECRLGQDFEVEERRAGLKRNRRELLHPVEPARRMDVKHRNREDQTPGHGADPTCDPAPGSSRPPADHMIGPVDGFEQGLEMSR
jgi:hypothetical protein